MTVSDLEELVKRLREDAEIDYQSSALDIEAADALEKQGGQLEVLRKFSRLYLEAWAEAKAALEVANKLNAKLVEVLRDIRLEWGSEYGMARLKAICDAAIAESEHE